MQRLPDLLGSVWPRGRRTESYVECRDCGTTLPDDATSCSVCGSADIARYEL